MKKLLGLFLCACLSAVLGLGSVGCQKKAEKAPAPPPKTGGGKAEPEKKEPEKKEPEKKEPEKKEPEKKEPEKKPEPKKEPEKKEPEKKEPEKKPEPKKEPEKKEPEKKEPEKKGASLAVPGATLVADATNPAVLDTRLSRYLSQ